MTHLLARLIALSLLVSSAAAASAAPATRESASPATAAQDPMPAAPYHPSRTLPIGGVGGWDYATLDASATHLYLPRTSHTQVIELASGRVVADIPGNRGSHGVALVPLAERGFISNGASGTLQIFDLKTHAVLGEVAAAEDADGVLYDPASRRVLVMCGDAGVLVPCRVSVDPKRGHADPAIALGGKPEFGAVDGHGRAFIALEDKDQVAVVDTRASKVVAHWPTGVGKGPVGMAIDNAHHRLYIGCRNQTMVVMDARNGQLIAHLPIGQGVDATAFDGDTALASCWDGTLTAIRETTPGHFAVTQTLKTAPGARTMAVDAKTGTVYLPAADMDASKPRPKPVPGTFKVLVVGKSH